ncbi:MAG: TrkA family potassium uptake protein [Desulfobacteraceae bacterium]|jgi:trk system potassium uptake protein TrkA|nr:TrkA family potassium uptake protein [Desulfobacteraceae bacterium]
MRIVFSGAGPATILATGLLIKKNHEVIIIDTSKEKIDTLSEKMDCSFLHGDASKPAILKEVNPKNCDFLFCLTDCDEVNIITSLLGRSLGFKRVVTSIENTELEEMCREIGLKDVVIPARSISRHIENMVEELEDIELSNFLKGEARLLSFIAGNEEAGAVSELDLPEDAKCIYYYRDEKFYLMDEQTRIKKGDEIVVVTHVDNLSELNKRWDSTQTNGG